MTAQPDQTTVPVLSCGVRLRHDLARGGWVLLAPERIVTLDDTAQAVVALADGRRDLATIAGILAKEYAVGGDDILADVIELVVSLRDSGLLEIKGT
uniref:pyrroloquinoline quinone biosynthesis peptide chaperone PqqD n=1 Tax=Castellaniella defragrans TaxID=75697 RepID=UPI00334183C9